MTIIKAICNTYGVMFDPRWEKALEKTRAEYTDTQWRNEEWRLNNKLIKLIEKKHNEIKFLQKMTENKRSYWEDRQKYQKKLKKLCNYDDNQSWTYFKIEEVDTSKPWYFSDYDGSISIQYLDKCNEELNMYTYNYNHSFKVMNMNLKEKFND